MNDVFIAFFEERDIIDLQYDKIRTLYRIVDTCQLSGLKVYISEEIINPIVESYRLLTSSPEYINELGTDWGDAIELLTTNMHSLRNLAHMYGVVSNYNNSQFNYIHELGPIGNPVFLYHTRPAVLGDAIVLCCPNGKVDIAKGIGLDNEEAVLNYLGKNRKFHIIEKHGENGRGHWPNASPLLCDRNHAQTLLCKAIHYPHRQNSAWQWDEDFAHYIKFYYEGDSPNPLWHGFHIAPDSNEIPERIKRYFCKR